MCGTVSKTVDSPHTVYETFQVSLHHNHRLVFILVVVVNHRQQKKRAVDIPTRCTVKSKMAVAVAHYIPYKVVSGVFGSLWRYHQIESSNKELHRLITS